MFLLNARTLAAQSNDTLDVYFFKDINFSDTAVLSTDYFTNQILDYITYEQAQQPSGRQMWGVILGVDHVLQLSSENYQVYKHVYQFLIEGFSALGYNEAIDYMMRIPYFYTMNVTEQQIEEMESLAESYDRVKIGNKAPLIEGKTIYNDYFNEEKFKLFKNSIIQTSGEKIVYIFSTDNCVDESIQIDDKSIIKPIPSKIYEIYKEISDGIKRGE